MSLEERGFESVILNIFNRWSALKLMVDHHMGGRMSVAKALYLVEYIHHILTNNQPVEAEDLEDILIEYVDREFNSTLEDNSPVEISRELIRLFSVYIAGGLSAAVDELKALPPVTEWLEYGAPARERRTMDSDSSDSDREIEQMEDGESEWTTVNYGRKR